MVLMLLTSFTLLDALKHLNESIKAACEKSKILANGKEFEQLKKTLSEWKDYNMELQYFFEALCDQFGVVLLVIFGANFTTALGYG